MQVVEFITILIVAVGAAAVADMDVLVVMDLLVEELMEALVMVITDLPADYVQAAVEVLVLEILGQAEKVAPGEPLVVLADALGLHMDIIVIPLVVIKDKQAIIYLETVMQLG